MSDEWLLNFQFDGIELKEKYNVCVTGTFKDPWFIAKDICDILDIKNNRKTLQSLPGNTKCVTFSYTLGGDQLMGTINEEGTLFRVCTDCIPIFTRDQ